ncbi:MAG TPA: hypothetical protein VFB12_14625 [Ktedonobacteraceae bacterium]|nr:hypothetical protein [Ktedonobacteraceae bacterium]
MEKSALPAIEEVQRLTRDYASYAHRRGGLGNVLGGLVMLAVVLLILLSKADLLIALITPGLMLSWLVGKELLRSYLYTPLGRATERRSVAMQWFHLLRVCLGVLLLGGIAVSVVIQRSLAFHQWWPLLVFLLLTPWIAWRYLRSGIEYLLGLFLLLVSLLASIGSDMRSYVVVALLLAFLSILLGLYEHLRFRSLVKEVLTLQQEALLQSPWRAFGDLTRRVFSVQLSWPHRWTFQPVSREALPGVLLIGVGMLFSLTDVLVLQQTLVFWQFPVIVLLLSFDEALHMSVVPAWARQGGRR